MAKCLKCDRFLGLFEPLGTRRWRRNVVSRQRLLIDGTKAYAHTVIDNFSRKILACTVAPNISALNTEEILIKAIQTAIECGYAGIIDIFSDKGCENVNDLMKEFFKSNDKINHILAKIDVRVCQKIT